MQNLASHWAQMLRSWNMRTLAITLGFVIAIAIFCSGAFAQSGAGSIEGTVSDPTGAVIPGASIHVVNQATGVAIDTKTNNVGFYQVPGLVVGTYVVSVTAPGMKTANQTIELQTAQTGIINAQMTTGAVTQQVTVAADTVELTTTDNGAVTATLENARLNELPMNGRYLYSLVNETTPGIENGVHSNASANGQQGAATEYVVDGASLDNVEFGGIYLGDFSAAHSVDPDSIQEVHVDSIAAPAQYASPLTVILTTKSGTNQLHGAAFETAQNNGFGQSRTRQTAYNSTENEYIRNEFGASVGGPIVIPHFYNGKNKSFFFFSFFRHSVAQQLPYPEYTPTLAMRQGDFSGLVNSSGVLQQLYNPYTTNLTGTTSCLEPPSVGTASNTQQWCRQPFGGSSSLGTTTNYIPTSLESPSTVILNEMSPLPTNANNPLVASNLSFPFPELLIAPQATFRIDQSFNENNRAYLRYTQGSNSNVNPHSDTAAFTLAVPSAGFPKWLSGESYTTNSTYAASIGFTHVFSPTFYSETVAGDTWMSERDLAGGNPNTDWESKLGVPNNFGQAGFPEFESIFQQINGTQYIYTMVWSLPTVDENLTKTYGKHQFQFGGRYRYEKVGDLPDESSDTINFGNGEDTGLYNPSTGNTPSAFSNTGQLNADEYLGGAESYNQNLQAPYQNMHDMEVDAYFQDNYRVNNNLTVNLGLRYEAHPAMTMEQGIMMGFDLKNDAVVTGAPTSQLISEGFTTQAIITNDNLIGMKFETPAQAGFPAKLLNDYNVNFSPRVGAAWQPKPKWGTVIRGAVGRYIYAPPLRETFRNVNRNNPFLASYTNTYTSAGNSPDNEQNYMLRAVPTNSSSYSYANTLPGGAGGTPILGVNSVNVVNTATTTAINPGVGLTTLNPDFPPDYVDEANFTIEQPLKWNSALRVSYVYTHGTNLNNPFYYNDHPSTFSWEVQTGTAPPTGTASVVSTSNTNTGQGPYDNLTYGSGNNIIQKSGWSNYHALQANFQKLYHAGSAWQLMGVWSKSLRTGGDFGGSSGDTIDPYVNFVNSGPSTVTYVPEGGATLTAPHLPPPPPTGTLPWQYYKALNRYENYMTDTNNPWLHIQFNGLVALPLGRGQRFLGNANKAWNEVVGGWQIAGDGSVTGQEFAVSGSHWGPTNPLHIMKQKITDCRSGVCLKSVEWFNGYIAPTAISGNACSAGLTNVVSGLPTSWAPYQSPVDTICSAPVGGKTVTDKYYGLDDVIINGVTGQSANDVIGYGDIPQNSQNGVSESSINTTNPFGHTILNGPTNWVADASLFKVFPITERVNFRMNADVFNVFNHQGLPNPSGSDGTVCYSAGGLGCSSVNPVREVQFTARLTF